jgi:uncharacterized protein (DUF1800 family)
MNRREFLTLDPAPSADLKKTAIPAGDPPPYFTSSRGLDRYHPTPGDPWDYGKAAHLLRRAMIGPTDAEIRSAVEEGLDATIERLTRPFEPTRDLIDYWAGEEPSISPPEGDQALGLAWTAEKLKRRELLGRWYLKVIVTAPVTLQERMTLFWHNHFVSEMRVVEYAEWMYGQNQLLRRSALGNFRQLVRDITIDMAMLIYLNGVDNYVAWNGRFINENYARELMELFTIGPVDWEGRPNYSQEDVREGARALSGWARTASPRGEHYAGLASRFVEDRWDPGEKSFLGRKGAWRALDVVDIIFEERAEQAARFICEKLYRQFVHDIPDRRIVAGMASTLRGAGWEIEPVLRQLLTSEHFYDPINIGALDHDIINYHIAFIRGMKLRNIADFDPALPIFPPGDLLGRLLKLGQMPFYPPNVKGWPRGRAWVSASTLPARQKFAIDVVTARTTEADRPSDYPRYAFDPIALARSFPNPDDPRLLCRDIATFLLGTPPSEKEVEMLLATLIGGGVDYEWDLNDMAQRPADRIRRMLKALVLLPKFQLY